MIKSLISFNVLFLVIFVQAQGYEWKEEKGILVLEKNNFDEAINQFKNLAVELYDPRCEGCKEFAPKYERIAKLVKQENLDIKISKFSMMSDMSITGRFSFESIPAVFLISNGKIISYNGEIEQQPVYNWFKSQLRYA